MTGAATLISGDKKLFDSLRTKLPALTTAMGGTRGEVLTSEMLTESFQQVVVIATEADMVDQDGLFFIIEKNTYVS